MNSRSSHRSSLHSKVRSGTIAFTLVDLLAVIAAILLLGVVAIRGMAGARAESWAAVCQNNVRQLGLGGRLFQQDHNEMFAPAGVHGQNFQLSWDSFIHPYIGGGQHASLSAGLLYPDEAPKTLRCPADIQPKVDWMGGDSLWFAIRSYAMVGAGSTWSTHFQVNTAQKTYPLPNIALGVGIYWYDESLNSPDWDAKSYKASAVQDPAATLLLVEQPNKQGAAASEWPCISLGVEGTGVVAGYSDLYQTDPNALYGAVTQNQGAYTYAIHGARFNYLFHDGHAARLKTNQTIGGGTLKDPKGMWPVVAGD